MGESSLAALAESGAAALGSRGVSVSISGFIGLGHPTRELQFVFINGRACARVAAVASAVEAAALCVARSPTARALPLTVETPDSSATRGGGRREASSEGGYPVFVVDVTIDPPSAVHLVHDHDRTLVDFCDWPQALLALTTSVSTAMGVAEEESSGEAAGERNPFLDPPLPPPRVSEWTTARVACAGDWELELGPVVVRAPATLTVPPRKEAAPSGAPTPSTRTHATAAPPSHSGAASAPAMYRRARTWLQRDSLLAGACEPPRASSRVRELDGGGAAAGAAAGAAGARVGRGDILGRGGDILGRSPYFSTPPAARGDGIGGTGDLTSAGARSYEAFAGKGLAFTATAIPRAGAAAGTLRSASSKHGPTCGAQDQAYLSHLRATLAAASSIGSASAASSCGSPSLASPSPPTPGTRRPAALPSHVTSLGGTCVDLALLQRLRVLGQVDCKFILAVAQLEGGARQLVILDQHAVDERVRLEAITRTVFPPPEGQAEASSSWEADYVLSCDGLVFERWAAGAEGGAPPRGPGAFLVREACAPPLRCAASPAEVIAVRHYQALLEAWGFLVSVEEPAVGAPEPAEGAPPLPPLGAAHTLLVAALPRLFDTRLRLEDLRAFLRLLLEAPHLAVEALPRLPSARESGGARAAADAALSSLFYVGLRPPAFVRVLNSKACRGAIMFGDRLSTPECEGLLLRLLSCALPFQCAHGRPAMLPIATLV